MVSLLSFYANSKTGDSFYSDFFFYKTVSLKSKDNFLIKHHENDNGSASSSEALFLNMLIIEVNLNELVLCDFTERMNLKKSTCRNAAERLKMARFLVLLLF